ncbi:Uncharacterized protein dnm_081510 [Desulfonema magnum]|uniref:Uncharacterized protein n=1 Tax=Desulfonema magnum TaxID=45655 RepID=A0A975BVE4_9BACT|nr:Uncharacterized protein dnm_081510 [Desulfonema magnum]
MFICLNPFHLPREQGTTGFMGDCGDPTFAGYSPFRCFINFFSILL